MSPTPLPSSPPAWNQQMINVQFKFESLMKNKSFFFKFEGQFDLDGQGLGHQFLNSPETCMM